MKISAIRKMEEGAIKLEIAKLQADFLQSKVDLRLGKEKDVKKSLKIKRNIARMLTVLKEISSKK